MRIVAYRPKTPLGERVESIWYFEGFEASHRLERILPNGAMQLLVNLDADELRWQDNDRKRDLHRLPGSAMAGAFARPFVIDTAQQQLITGVSFAPGGASAFFRASMRAFANDHVPLADLPGCRTLRDRLLEAHHLSVPEVMQTWERFLASRLHLEHRRDVGYARSQLEAGLSVQ